MAIQDLILCIDDFNADPFNETAPELCLLQSGVIVYAVVLDL